MKKSVYTFGLLLSSLVMLSAIPFLNNNVSNIVMAQEYDKYRDSYYSQYPTDDNKYQCRTGPFEGFFVSSVEFCKHVKFDDRKDNDRKDNNQTGTQGPPGPPGPPGVPGPQGERGLTGMTGATGPASTIPGPQGPMGFNGTQGPQGIQGERGFNGTQGPQGLPGANGTQGPPGIVNAELCPAGTYLENVYVLNGTTAESCDRPSPCEDCFAQELNSTQFAAVEAALTAGITIIVQGAPVPVQVSSFAELCDLIDANPLQIISILQQVVNEAGLRTLDTPTFFAIIDCIATALNIDLPG